MIWWGDLRSSNMTDSHTLDDGILYKDPEGRVLRLISIEDDDDDNGEIVR